MLCNPGGLRAYPLAQKDRHKNTHTNKPATHYHPWHITASTFKGSQYQAEPANLFWIYKMNASLATWIEFPKLSWKEGELGGNPNVVLFPHYQHLNMAPF